MNPEQQQIAIAKAHGRVQRPDGSWVPIGKDYGSAGIPNYLKDLNAMHEVEKVLPRHLYHVDYWQKGYGRFQMVLSVLTITPYSATASQRAEAFLRTIGKWEESK